MEIGYDAIRLLRDYFICPQCGYDDAMVVLPPKQRADQRLSICESQSHCTHCYFEWVTVFDIVAIRQIKTSDNQREVCQVCQDDVNSCTCWRCMSCEQLQDESIESFEDDDGELVCATCNARD